MAGRPQRRNRRSVLRVATYSRGDHLRVGRLPIAGRFLYYHHGIYVGDDRVVQFEGQLWNKPRSGIDEVPLERFSKRGVSEILDHTNLRFPAECRCLRLTRPNGSLRGRAALSRPASRCVQPVRPQLRDDRALVRLRLGRELATAAVPDGMG